MGWILAIGLALPAATERGFRQGGFAVPAGVTRADWRASYRRLAGLVGAMHKAGVPIVAGTDVSGMELARELELYVNDAGFTPAEALAAATIVPGRLVGPTERPARSRRQGGGRASRRRRLRRQAQFAD